MRMVDWAEEDEENRSHLRVYKRKISKEVIE